MDARHRLHAEGRGAAPAGRLRPRHLRRLRARPLRRGAPLGDILSRSPATAHFPPSRRVGRVARCDVLPPPSQVPAARAHWPTCSTPRLQLGEEGVATAPLTASADRLLTPRRSSRRCGPVARLLPVGPLRLAGASASSPPPSHFNVHHSPPRLFAGPGVRVLAPAAAALGRRRLARAARL